jgi:hypothetical protein
MKKIFFLISICATLLIGCDKEISLVLDNNEPVLVIDGSITDQAGPYFVQLSMSSPITIQRVSLELTTHALLLRTKLELKTV